MKIKLLLLFVITFSLAGSCEPETLQEQTDCNCEKVYYDYKVKMDGVKATFYYEKTFTEPTYCQDATGKYVQIGSNKFFKIECE